MSRALGPIAVQISTLSLLSILIVNARADSRPGWFAVDYRSAKEWGFYCESEGKTEDEALSMARSQCASKICMLFGVEVSSETKTHESLKEANVSATVIERCPNVRVVGRVEKKKLVSCEDGSCGAYIFQLYPKTEYDKEHKRLNAPKIVKTFEKTIIIREGNETFKDPAPCKKEILAYSKTRGESQKTNAERIMILSRADEVCRGLDYRDLPLQSQFSVWMTDSLYSRSTSNISALSYILGHNTKLEDRIAAVLEYEKKLAQGGTHAPKIKEYIQAHFDQLFAYSHVNSKGQFILSTGGTSPTVPYFDERKTCKTWSELALLWSPSVSEDIRVCATYKASPEEVKTGQRPVEECDSLNLPMVKAFLASCLCLRDAPKARLNSCASKAGMSLHNDCQGAVTQSCIDRAIQAGLE